MIRNCAEYLEVNEYVFIGASIKKITHLRLCDSGHVFSKKL